MDYKEIANELNILMGFDGIVGKKDVNDIRLLLTKDKFELDYIIDAIMFAKRSDFWSKLLANRNKSVKWLRTKNTAGIRKIDTLIEQMESKKGSFMSLANMSATQIEEKAVKCGEDIFGDALISK
jgi:hypothetical protein